MHYYFVVVVVFQRFGQKMEKGPVLDLLREIVENSARRKSIKTSQNNFTFCRFRLQQPRQQQQQQHWHVVVFVWKFTLRTHTHTHHTKNRAQISLSSCINNINNKYRSAVYSALSRVLCAYNSMHRTKMSATTTGTETEDISSLTFPLALPKKNVSLKLAALSRAASAAADHHRHHHFVMTPTPTPNLETRLKMHLSR